ncbi:platelet-activating factor receptor [Polymixia lowei]
MLSPGVTAVMPVSLGVTGNSTPDSTASINSTFLDSEFRYVLFPAFYGIVFILGVFANCYVLFVLRWLREARAIGEIRIYMANLTLADLLFVSALPFWIDYYSRQGNWIYPDFLCRLTGSMFFINTYCSILFLGAISVNRYWAITQPLNAAASDCWRRGVMVTVVIWAVTLGMSVPFLLSPGTHTDEKNMKRCFEGYHTNHEDKKKLVAVTHFLIIAMFFIVFFLVVVCNLLIARALLKQPPQSLSGITVSHRGKSTKMSSSARPRGVKRRALHMLCAVVGVFVVCFLPHHLIQGPWVLAVLQIKEGLGNVSFSPETLQALNDAHQITLLLMGLNCILDPVVYCFATRKFRKFIMSHVKKVVKGEACAQTTISQISMESRNQSQRLHSEQEQLQR